MLTKHRIQKHEQLCNKVAVELAQTARENMRNSSFKETTVLEENKSSAMSKALYMDHLLKRQCVSRIEQPASSCAAALTRAFGYLRVAWENAALKKGAQQKPIAFEGFSMGSFFFSVFYYIILCR